MRMPEIVKKKSKTRAGHRRSAAAYGTPRARASHAFANRNGKNRSGARRRDWRSLKTALWLLVPPVGLALMWKRSCRWPTALKAGVTAFAVGVPMLYVGYGLTILSTLFGPASVSWVNARFGEGSNDMIRDFLKDAYESIRSGEFDREWRKEQDEYNLEHLNALRAKALSTDVTQAEDRLFARLKGSERA